MGTSGKNMEKGGKNIVIQASLQEYVNEEINQNMDLNGSGHQQIIRKWVSGMNIPLKSETYQSTTGISTMKMSWKHGNGQDLITIRWWFPWSSVDDQVWITTTTGQASSRCFFVLAKCPRKLRWKRWFQQCSNKKKTHVMVIPFRDCLVKWKSHRWWWLKSHRWWLPPVYDSIWFLIKSLVISSSKGRVWNMAQPWKMPMPAMPAVLTRMNHLPSGND